MNLVYPEFVRAMGDQEVDLAAVSYSFQAVDMTGAYDRTNTVLDDLSASLLGTAEALPSVTWTVQAAGLELAANDAGLEITTLSLDDDVQAIVVFIDTGSAATSTLVAWYDRKADSSPVEGISDGDPAPLTWPPDGVFVRFPC